MMSNDDVRAEMLADVPLYKRVRQELLAEIRDPEVSLFRNLRSLTSADWENFNCTTGTFELCADSAAADANDTEDDENPGPTRRRKKKKRKIHVRRTYHYKIGEYYTSTYYTKFLSDSVVHVPGESDATVRCAKWYFLRVVFCTT
jgi:hypothetical protein